MDETTPPEIRFQRLILGIGRRRWSLPGMSAFLPILAATFVVIPVPAYADDAASAQMAEGIALASGGEAVVADYFRKNGTWPPNIHQIYATAAHFPVGRYVVLVSAITSADGASYGIVATLKANDVDARVASKAVEIWSNNGGATWHCGPASINAVDPQYLPASCRESGAP